MADCELLRFGQSARLTIGASAELGEQSPPELIAGLTEARIEWKKRFPKLPLSDSF
ncbi:MAG TPA: hypothetical protein VGF20_10730 [Candidatus Acidoferrum sp.]|jgi:hypothetical protein